MPDSTDPPTGTIGSPEPAGQDAADPGAVFGSLAAAIYAGAELTEAFQAICLAAPVLVPGCDHASLMMLAGGRFKTVAASSDVARLIDDLELELGEGPCLDAITDEVAHIDPDLTDGSPWPALTREILARTQVRGMAGFRLLEDEQKVGAINLFSETPGALNPEALDRAAVLAAFASVALLAVSTQQSAESLRSGLASNREVGKAVGLLMAFHKISDEEAFEVLRKTSQDLNVKVTAIARELVEHHNRR
jgi:hypothetical protein